ncbi:MAG: lysophospholipid acyltransferase family protein [Anaerolineae bacterium]
MTPTPLHTQRTPEINIAVTLLARFIFRLMGWQSMGEVPNIPKMVIIGAPHTSNWDGFYFYLITLILRTKLRFLGKHTLFRPPFGGIMRWAGGIPINRATSKNAVEQAVDAFNQSENMALVIAAEGTRKKTKFWKTGFYYIALGAKVPIVLGYVNYATRTAGIGPHFMPSGDIEKDFETIQKFYEDKVGRHPERKSDVALPPKP